MKDETEIFPGDILGRRMAYLQVFMSNNEKQSELANSDYCNWT